MAEKTGIYCPICEKQGIQAELIRGNPELHLFRCISNHALTYNQLYGPDAQFTPTMAKLVAPEKPAPTDVKAEFWIDPNVLSKFSNKYPLQKNATVNSILAMLCDGDVIIISGEHAKKLKALNVKTGADMVACAEENKRLDGQNGELVKENARFWDAMRGKMNQAEAEV